MKTKLFNALKQDHSKLGLGDEVLQAYADSLASTGLVTDENIATISKGQETALKAYQSSIDKERTERANIKKELDELKAKGGDPKPSDPQPKPTDDLDAKLEALINAKVAPLQEKLTAYETKEAKATRQAQILGKAKELGIPDWRINEGFTIGDDADEASISTTLSAIKQNIVTAGLEQSKGFPIDANKTPSKEELDGIIGNIGL
nr:MAG TPA: hypothetical protein [Caudoviricetes sp.]